MEKLQAGSVLIADPFLKDSNFLRTAIFLCEHQRAGSLGFVLNRKISYVIGDLFDNLNDCDFPVFYGGPVQQNTIHFLHCCPELISGSEKVIDDIFWSGNFDEVAELLKAKKLKQNQIKLFLGYSGWAEEQLENELSEKTWLITYGSKNLIFLKDEKQIWPQSLRQMGGKYEQLINYPTDPQLN